MNISHLDHIVLTVADIEKSIAFYELLGMEKKVFGSGRIALHFGSQKINLHQVGNEVKPNAARATAGSADLCFISSTPLDEVVNKLKGNLSIELGPVKRTGAQGAIKSIYLRDPDGNLIEISNLE